MKTHPAVPHGKYLDWIGDKVSQIIEQHHRISIPNTENATGDIGVMVIAMFYPFGFILISIICLLYASIQSLIVPVYIFHAYPFSYIYVPEFPDIFVRPVVLMLFYSC